MGVWRAPLFAILLLLQFSTNSAQLDRVDPAEKYLAQIAAEVTKIWSTCPASCEPSILNCANDLGSGYNDSACSLTGIYGSRNSLYQDYYDATQCSELKSCSLPHTQKFNLEKGFLRLPRYIDYSDEKIILDTCRLQKLDKIFQSIIDLDQSQLPLYFGTANGPFRIFPGQAYTSDATPRPSTLREAVDKCAQYDPRARPWYRDALRGKAEIVILMDISTFIAGEQYNEATSDRTTIFQVGKAAIASFLSNASREDEAVTVITFSKTASIAFQVKWPKDPGEQKKIVDKLESIDPSAAGNAKNYTDAFRLAFDTLDHIVDGEKTFCGSGSPPHKIILLFAGSEEGILTTADMNTTLDYIGKRQATTEATILTYKLGPDSLKPATDKLLKSIACRNSGVFTQISIPSSAPAANDSAHMPQFFMAFHLLGGNASRNVYWSRSHKAPLSTKKEKVTAAQAVYDESGVLIGVVGVDLTNLPPDTPDINTRIDAAGDCRGAPGWNECQLQVLRSRISYDSLTPGYSICESTDYEQGFVQPPDFKSCRYTPQECTGPTLTETQVYAPVGKTVEFVPLSCCQANEPCSAGPSPPPPSPSPPPPPIPVAAIIGGVAGGVVVISAGVFACMYMKHRRQVYDVGEYMKKKSRWC